MHAIPSTLENVSVAVARPVCQVSKTLATVSEHSVEFSTNQVFMNDNEYPLKGILIFPLPREKSVQVTEVSIDGTRQKFEILYGDVLLSLLKKITIQTEDPALMAMASGLAIVTDPLTLNIRESKSFRIIYRIPFQINHDVFDLSISMEGERYALAPVGEFEALVRFKMARPVRTSISTSHKIKVENESYERRLVSVRETQVKRPDDFRLITSFGGTGLDIKLLFYQSRDKENYFLSFIEPPLSSLGRKQSSLDLAILLDCSSSMGEDQLALGKRAVALLLEQIRPLDRFDMIKITSRQRRLFQALSEALPDRVSAGVKFLDDLNDGDGTDLYNGILCGLETVSSKKRQSSILLISDGKATIGRTGAETLLEMIRRQNKNKTRIFVLALGDSPDLTILDHVAKITGGSVFRVSNSVGFETFITRWLSNIIAPKVEDLSVNLKDLEPESLAPDPIPEIVGSDAVIIAGRCRHDLGREAAVSVSGKIGGKSASQTKRLTDLKADGSYEFVPQIWAMRRMAHLMDIVRTKGQNHLLAEQMRNLSDKFGFEIREPIPGGEQAFSELLWKYKTSLAPEEVTMSGHRRIGKRLFKRRNGSWSEKEAVPPLPEHNLFFLSEEYFDLIKSNPDLGPIMALSPEITFRDGDRLIRVTPASSRESP